MQTNLIETLTNQLSLSLGVELEASGRHVHLSKEDVTALFGPHASLTPVRPLSQPGSSVPSGSPWKGRRAPSPT